MSVTTTAIGTYTKQLTIAAELDSAAFITALDAAIVTGAYWAQFDIVNTYYRVYRSLNKDGVSYKYAVVSIDPWQQRVRIQALESWNATTHVGTNYAYNGAGTFWQPYTFNNCDFVVFAGPRWLGFLSYVRNITSTQPSFVIETTREHTQDTSGAGVPCWISINPAQSCIGEPWSSNLWNFFFAYPRDKGGNVGITQAKVSWVSTPFGRLGNTDNGWTLSRTTGITPLLGTTGSGVVDAWDGTVNYVYSLKCGYGAVGYHGRMFALKFGFYSGAAFMNRVAILCDTDFFYSAAGSSLEHWVLPVYKPSPIVSFTPTTVFSGMAAYNDLIWNGSFIYAVKSSAVAKMSLDTLIVSTLDTTASTNNTSMVFDGRYIYFCCPSSNKVGKIDTTTDTVTYSAALTGGGVSPSRICFDGTNLWVQHQAVVTTTIWVTKLDTTLAVVASIALAAASTSLGAGIACSPNGEVCALVADSTTQANNKIHRISGTTVSGSVALPSGSAFKGLVQWSGEASTYLVLIDTATISTAISTFRADCSTTTPTIVGGAVLGTCSASGATTTQVPTQDTGGDLYLHSHWCPNGNGTTAQSLIGNGGAENQVAQSNTLTLGRVVHFGTHRFELGTAAIYMVTSTQERAQQTNTPMFFIPK